MKTNLGIITFMLLLWGLSACTLRDHAGVTSTGNAGEIAGFVYQNSSTALSRKFAATADLNVQDSARVYLLNQSGALLDSMVTNVDGAFWFKALAAGTYGVRVVWGTDTALLENIDLQKDEVYQASMILGGQSGTAGVSTPRVSVFATQPASYQIAITLAYLYDTATHSIVVTRDTGKANLISTWGITFSDPNMTLCPSGKTCPPGLDYFSTNSGVIRNNNWFYNGSLETDSLVLGALPEMGILGVSNMELSFTDDSLKVSLYDDSWCLLQDSHIMNYYAQIISDSMNLSAVNCNTLSISGIDNKTYQIRVLDFDALRLHTREEISDSSASCVRTGAIANLFAGTCRPGLITP